MRAWLVGLGIVALAAGGCKKDDSGNDDMLMSLDQSVKDQTSSFAGNQCAAAVCSGTTDICCFGDNEAPACAGTCNKTFSFKCDGPEDCSGGACCLTITNAGQPSHTFSAVCQPVADCAPTLSPTANPIKTARCHTNDDCADYNSILSKCCHNVGEDNLTFCAIPFSSDFGVNVVCQN